MPERPLFKRNPIGHLKDFKMISDSSETTIDEIVATCNGDIRGALKALLMVNEQLETELRELHAAMAHRGLSERGSTVLH